MPRFKIEYHQCGKFCEGTCHIFFNIATYVSFRIYESKNWWYHHYNLWFFKLSKLIALFTLINEHIHFD